MARTSPEIEVKEVYSDDTQAARSSPVMFAADMAELIKRMIADGRLEVKDGQVMPKGK